LGGADDKPKKQMIGSLQRGGKRESEGERKKIAEAKKVRWRRVLMS